MILFMTINDSYKAFSSYEQRSISCFRAIHYSKSNYTMRLNAFVLKIFIKYKVKSATALWERWHLT